MTQLFSLLCITVCIIVYSLQHVAADCPPQTVANWGLDIDSAAVRFVSLQSNSVSAYWISDECYPDCLPWPAVSDDDSLILTAGAITNYTAIDARWGLVIQIRDAANFEAVLAEQHFHFNEHQYSTIVLSDPPVTGEPISMQLIVDDSGSSRYFPLYVGIGVMAALWLSIWFAQLCWFGFGKAYYQSSTQRPSEEQFISSAPVYGQAGQRVANDYQSMLSNREPVTNTSAIFHPSEEIDTSVTQIQTEKKPKSRLQSLDTFRGLALTIMVFVNYGGGNYWFFNHSLWNGLTVADLVFPWFIWMMGASMALSFHSQMKPSVLNPPNKWNIFKKVVRRTCILLALGLLVSNSGAKWNEFRIMGVLQRFAVSYFFVSCIVLFTPQNKPTVDSYRKYYEEEGEARGPISDITDHLFEWIIVAGLVATHIMITFLLNVPDCPTGYLGAGGISNYAQNAGCVGGAAGYIDRKILGLSHVYGSPTSQDIYGSGAYDPEGLLGCLTSIVMTYLGLSAGRILLYWKQPVCRIKRWAAHAIFFGTIACILCEGAQNGGFIPINKNLWSVSFIFCLSSFAMILLSILYVIVDVKELWSGSPFVYMGMNSIVIYVGSEVLSENFPFNWRQSDDCAYSSHAFILTKNLVAITIWLALAAYMASIKFFIKI